jgi:hypothetical protein
MAKVKKPMLPPANFNPSVFEQKEVSSLPTAENVTSAAAILTGQELPVNQPVKQKEGKAIKEGKEPKEKKIEKKDKSNRVGITALIEPVLLKKVKIYALDKGISMSDVCNMALDGFLKNNR